MNQETQKTIDALMPIAQSVATHVRDYLLQYGGEPHHFRKYDGNLMGVWSAERQITFRHPHGAEVIIGNLDVPEVLPEDIVVGPIVPTGPQKVVRASVMEYDNDTLNVIERELKYRDLEAQSKTDNLAREVGASMAAGFRQQIGYGGDLYGISGETEFSLNLEASFKQAWEESVTRSKEHEMESLSKILNSVMHKLYVDRVEQVGPAKQITKAKGRINFSVAIHTPGHWIYQWDNRRDMLANWQGVHAESNVGFLDFYKAHPVPNANNHPVFQSVWAEVETVREFEESSSLKVHVREEPLNNEAAYKDALKLITMFSNNEQLKALAQQELDA